MMKNNRRINLMLLLIGIGLMFACGGKTEIIEAADVPVEELPQEPVVAEVPEIEPSPGDIVEIRYMESYTLDQAKSEVIPFFDKYSYPELLYGVDYYRVKYISTDFDGSRAEILAQLFIPVMDGEQELISYVFGSGTTGIGDACAPSLERPHVRRWGWYKQNMIAYAASGFITIFPDYLGFNDPDRPQRYFFKEAEAHVMLDAIRALNNLLGTPGNSGIETNARLSEYVFTAGYSQGGHAAFASADLKKEYAPEVNLTGLIGYAPTTEIAALFREGVCYGPEILYTFMMMYGRDKINPADYVAERFVLTFEEDTSTMAVDFFQKYYGYNAKKLFTPRFYDALFNDTLDQDFPDLARFIRMNNTGLEGHDIPAFVVQGGTDFIVTNASQTKFVEKLKEAGRQVKYTIYPGVSHKFTRMAGFTDSVEWMRSFVKSENGASEDA